MPPQGMPQPPQVYNPPPQIFGGYAPDGLPNMSMPDLGQNLFPDATLMDESIEAKRRRIARVGFSILERALEVEWEMEIGMDWGYVLMWMR